MKNAIDRGWDGRLPRTPLLEDESYLAFYEGVRNYAINEMFPRAGEAAQAAVAAAGIPDDGAARSMAEIEPIVDRAPAVGVWKRVMRSQQQRSWSKIRETLYADQAKYEAELDAAAAKAPQRLHIDPAFVTPDYAAREIHLQPGGYVGDSLAGYVFHHGTKVFYQGMNDQDELHQGIATLVVPPEGALTRVLDIGCSIGQVTTALKERFPAADIWGMDVGKPMVRYAHKRAVDLGIDVHFAQGLAEDTKFPDGHFDAVLAYILFHEVPSQLFLPIIREMYRVLRPGGVFTIVDAPNGSDFPLPNRIWMKYDAEYNCEPYAPAFVASDLPGMLREAGFELLDMPAQQLFLHRTVAKKPG
jgi:ubiquinone/menaquinone biosynthesis C-methylase UbiE